MRKKKIVGATVGTPISPQVLFEKTEQGIQNIVNKALAQAKASGEFKGEPGKTPEKGVDYYTDSDKQEMVNLVLNALPTWQGGAY